MTPGAAELLRQLELDADRDAFGEALMAIDPRDPRGRKVWVVAAERAFAEREERLYSEFAGATGLPPAPDTTLIGTTTPGLPGVGWATARTDLSQLQAARQALADTIAARQMTLKRTTLTAAQRKALERQVASFQAQRDQLDAKIAAEKDRVRKLGYDPATGAALSSSSSTGAALYQQLEERMGLPK